MAPRRLSRTLLLYGLIVVCLTLLGPAPAASFWPAGGTPLCTTSAFERCCHVLAPDGSGGAFVAWQDLRASFYVVYVHHVLASGNADLAWPLAGLPASLADGDQLLPDVASDGNGGVFVCWEQRISIKYNIHVQHLSATGASINGWPANGLVVSSPTRHAHDSRVCPDGSGGVYVVWHESSGNEEIYAQHLTASGTIATGWPGSGPLAICAAANDQFNPQIAPDGSGGAYMTWTDKRGTSFGQIYGVQVTSAGAIANGWTAGGTAIYNGNEGSDAARPVSDGHGGVLVEFSLTSLSDRGVCAERMHEGTHTWVTRRSVSTVGQLASDAAPVADGSGGGVFTFAESSNFGDIRANRVSAAGTLLWGVNGAAVCTEPHAQTEPVAVTDGTGGAIIAWHDDRSGVGGEIWAQRIDSLGATQWASNGVAIAFTGSATTPVVTTDGSGGAILTWSDSRPLAAGVYAARVNLGGITGPSAVTLGSVVASVDGGSVRLSWSAFLDGAAAFQVLRASSANGAYVAVSDEIQAGASQSEFGWRDESARPGAVYFYEVGYRQGAGWKYSAPVRVMTGAAQLALRISGENPASAGTRLEFQVARAGRARLEIMDSLGRRLRTLLDARVEAGLGSAHWEGRAQDGGRAPAGVYYVRLSTPWGAVSKKIVQLP